MNIRYRVTLTQDEREELARLLSGGRQAARKRPVVCFDESPVQLIGEARLTVPPEPGRIARYDCEYRRNGTANRALC